MPSNHLDVPVEVSKEPRGLLLLVEEDRDLRSVLRDVLEFDGYRVVALTTAAAAVPMVAGPVDAVVLSCVGTPLGLTESMAELAEAARTHAVPLVVVAAEESLPEWAHRLGTPYATSLRSIDELFTVVARGLSPRQAAQVREAGSRGTAVLGASTPARPPRRSDPTGASGASRRSR